MSPQASFSNPVLARFTPVKGLADASVYITMSIAEAEEVIKYNPVPQLSKLYYLEVSKPLAEKVVYLANPQEVKRYHCPVCGGQKLSAEFRYCGSDTFCGGRLSDPAVLQLLNIIG